MPVPKTFLPHSSSSDLTSVLPEVPVSNTPTYVMTPLGLRPVSPVTIHVQAQSPIRSTSQGIRPYSPVLAGVNPVPHQRVSHGHAIKYIQNPMMPHRVVTPTHPLAPPQANDPQDLIALANKIQS